MSDYFIIAFISHEWKMFQRVPHYTAMSKYAKVLCVELPLTVFDAIFRPVKIWRHRYKIKNRLRQVNKNLLVYTPLAIFPFGISYRSGFFSRLNRFFISREIEKLIRRLRINRYIFIIHSPHLSCLVDILNPLARIYEVVDEYSCSEEDLTNENKLDYLLKVIEKGEQNILAKADIVFAASRKLYERKSFYNKNTYFVSNGVDLEHFWDHENRTAQDMAAIPKPRIGYIGHINAFLDFEWLDYCAVKRPEWSFVFLGAVDTQNILNNNSSYQQLISRKNVFMLGWKKYDDLPAYMRQIDVFLLPRKNCTYSQNSNPNKIYQYLSTGKPVVSSRFDSVEPFAKCIYIATDKIAFLKNIEEAVNEKDDSLKTARFEHARQNSLLLKAKEKMEIINTHLKI